MKINEKLLIELVKMHSLKSASSSTALVESGISALHVSSYPGSWVIHSHYIKVLPHSFQSIAVFKNQIELAGRMAETWTFANPVG